MGKVLQFAAFEPRLQFDAFNDLGPGDLLECGWLAFDDGDPLRTEASKAEPEEHAARDSSIAAMPDLSITGVSAYRDVTKVQLWDCWAIALGKEFIGIRQLRGSCVGAGGGNACFSLGASDVVKRRDREKAMIPFWLLPYGISRMLGGMNRPGDGSFGSTFADAVREYGHIPADTEGLPKYREDDGLIWGSQAELDWSVGRSIAKKWLDMAKPHLVKSTARCKSADDVREAIKSFYPVTIASNWGGQMRPGTTGDPAVLLNKRVTSWSHQMSVHAWWDHPTLGELFWVQNQWGIETHGRCPSGAPGGGFWIKRSEMDWICRNGEAFTLSQFDGFPAPEQPLDFSAF